MAYSPPLTVNPPRPKTIAPEDFFDGVAEMRAHLDRTGASRARGELTRMATELVRPRASFRAWLCEGLRSALEARGVALLKLSAEVDTAVGVIKRLPKPAKFAAMLTQSSPVSTDDGSLVVLDGLTAPIGAIWLERHASIDARAVEILRALLGAAAMML